MSNLLFLLNSYFYVIGLQSTKAETGRSGSSYGGSHSGESDSENRDRCIEISSMSDATSPQSADQLFAAIASPQLQRVPNASPDRKLPTTTQPAFLYPVFDLSSPLSSFYSPLSLSSKTNTTNALDDAAPLPGDQHQEANRKSRDKQRRRCKRRLVSPDADAAPSKAGSTTIKAEAFRPESAAFRGDLFHALSLQQQRLLNDEYIEQLSGRLQQMSSSRFPLLSASSLVSDPINGRFGCSPLAATAAMAYLQATGYDVATAADISRWFYATGQIQSKIDDFSSDCWATKVMDAMMASAEDRTKDLVTDVQPLDLSPLVKRIAVKQLN
jgi:hypothetical protein